MGVRRPPLEEWADQISCDPWLQARVRELAGSQYEWSWLVAESMIFRFLENPDHSGTGIEKATRRRDFLLDRIEPIRKWGQSLTPSEVQEVVDLGLVTLEALDLRLTDLSASVNPNTSKQTAVWMADFVQFCHERDDLEGVFMFVRDTPAGSTLVRAIEVLDQRARAFVEILFPAEEGLPELDDEHLRRVWLGDGESVMWWSRPAVISAV